MHEQLNNMNKNRYIQIKKYDTSDDGIDILNIKSINPNLYFYINKISQKTIYLRIAQYSI